MDWISHRCGDVCGSGHPDFSPAALTRVQLKRVTMVEIRLQRGRCRLMTELPTGIVTLLLADVQGSTRLWETRPDEMAAAVATMETVITQLVAVHGGARPLEQGEGDSFVIAFRRPADAVACALDF